MNKRASELPKLRNGSVWRHGEVWSDGNRNAVILRETDEAPGIETQSAGIRKIACASDVLALLDANGLNTTANELRDRAEKSLEIALRLGGIDGDHHKAWVIDQMVRALTGDGYDEFVSNAKAGKNGPDTYEWSTGIAP